MKRNGNTGGILIKAVFVLILVGYLAILCMRGYARDISVSVIKDSFEAGGLLEGLNEMKEKDLRKYYGIESKNCGGYFFCKAESTMAVDEILIIKANSQNDASVYEAAAKKRLENQIKSFDGYGIAQTAQLKKAYAERKGRYVIYMAGKNAEKWKDAFDKAVK